MVGGRGDLSHLEQRRGWLKKTLPIYPIYFGEHADAIKLKDLLHPVRYRRGSNRKIKQVFFDSFSSDYNVNRNDLHYRTLGIFQVELKNAINYCLLRVLYFYFINE